MPQTEAKPFFWPEDEASHEPWLLELLHGHNCAVTGKIDKAVAHFENAIALRPDRAEPHYNLAYWLLEKDPAQAAVHSLQAVEIRSDIPEQHLLLGRALLSIGEHRLAFCAFRSAIRIRPDFATAYFGIGQTLGSTQRFRWAVTALQTAVELNPDFAEAQYGLGLYSWMIGQYDDAVGALRTACRLDPFNAEYSRQLNNSLFRANARRQSIGSISERNVQNSPVPGATITPAGEPGSPRLNKRPPAPEATGHEVTRPAETQPAASPEAHILSELPASLRGRGYVKRDKPEDPETVKKAYRAVNAYSDLKKSDHEFSEAEREAIRAGWRVTKARYRRNRKAKEQALTRS